MLINIDYFNLYKSGTHKVESILCMSKPCKMWWKFFDWFQFLCTQLHTKLCKVRMYFEFITFIVAHSIWFFDTVTIKSIFDQPRGLESYLDTTYVITFDYQWISSSMTNHYLHWFELFIHNFKLFKNQRFFRAYHL